MSHDFAMWTFFPQKMQECVIIVSELTYAMANMCGFIDGIRRYLEGKSIFQTQKQTVNKEEGKQEEDQESKNKLSSDKNVSPLQAGNKGAHLQDSAEKKKKALDFLDEQISLINKNTNKKGNSLMDDEIASKALKGLLSGSDKSKSKNKKSSGWPDEQDEDENNDLTIDI